MSKVTNPEEQQSIYEKYQQQINNVSDSVKDGFKCLWFKHEHGVRLVIVGLYSSYSFRDYAELYYRLEKQGIKPNKDLLFIDYLLPVIYEDKSSTAAILFSDQSLSVSFRGGMTKPQEVKRNTLQKSKITFYDFFNKYHRQNIGKCKNEINFDAQGCVTYVLMRDEFIVKNTLTTVQIMKSSQFKSIVDKAHVFVTHDGKIIKLTFYQYFMGIIKLITFNDTTFNPNTEEKSKYEKDYNTNYNTFRGFKYNTDVIEDKKKGKLQDLLDFLKEIHANNDEVFYNYYLDWMSFMLQKPHELPGTCIILKGGGGEGKSLFWEFFRKRIIGEVVDETNFTQDYRKKQIEDLHLKNVALIIKVLDVRTTLNSLILSKRMY